MANRQIMTFVLIGLVLLTGLNSVFTVDQRQRALLSQWGRTIGSNYAPGLHFKLPFIQSVRMFDARALTLDNQTDVFQTQDGKSLRADYFVKWRIADTEAYYGATGGDDTVALDRLGATVSTALRETFAHRTTEQALGSGDFLPAVPAMVSDVRTQLGIDVVDVQVKRLDYPDDVRDKVYERMRAGRHSEAAKLRAEGAEAAEKIRADADQQAQVVEADAYGEAERTRGEGDAKAAAIYAKAYGQDPEFYRFWRSLEAYRESLGGKDVLVLEPDSEFFRYFKGAGGGTAK